MGKPREQKSVVSGNGVFIIIYIIPIDILGVFVRMAPVKAKFMNTLLALSSRFSRLSYLGLHLVRPILMKKTSRGHSPSESSHRGGTACRTKGGWAFNLTSERLFAFGSIASGKRGAYLTAQGEVRFLSL